MFEFKEWGAKYGAQSMGRKGWGAKFWSAKCGAQSMGRKVWGAKWVNPAYVYIIICNNC